MPGGQSRKDELADALLRDRLVANLLKNLNGGVGRIAGAVRAVELRQRVCGIVEQLDLHEGLLRENSTVFRARCRGWGGVGEGWAAERVVCNTRTPAHPLKRRASRRPARSAVLGRSTSTSRA